MSTYVTCLPKSFDYGEFNGNIREIKPKITTSSSLFGDLTSNDSFSIPSILHV